MKFLFISKQGDGWTIAQRLKKEGNKVEVYIDDKDSRLVGDGLVQKSKVDAGLTRDKSKLRELLLFKPDVIVFDMVGNGLGKIADELRKDGYNVIGDSIWADRIELDRPYGYKVMKIHKINTPKTYVFTNYDDAIKFVENKDKPFVFKPSNNMPTYTTYVSKGSEDLIGILESYSTKIKGEFELQERVDGIEVSTELWFNGDTVANVNHTMEEKSLMNDGIGMKTGCMGDVVWRGNTNSRLFKEGIGKMVSTLRKIDYRGMIDLNTIVTKDKLYALEFCPRFGYNAIFSFFELLDGSIGNLLHGIAGGSLYSIELKVGFGMSVTLALPPYPIDKCEDYSKDTILQGFNPGNLRHTWFYDVYKKSGVLMSAGNSGDIGAVTAYSNITDVPQSIREVRRRVYRTISNLTIPNVMYRTDIGSRVIRDYNTLKEWGWI